MSAREVLKLYGNKINLHRFSEVDALISDDAVFWFSSGTFSGKPAIRDAFEKTWMMIQDEVYSLSDLHWISEDATTAVCLYTFHWKGSINGQEKSGSGRGTSVLFRTTEGWKIKHEHLSAEPQHQTT